MKIPALLAAVALTALAISDAVAETSVDSRIAQLEEAVRALEQRVEVLEDQLRVVSTPTAVAPTQATWRKLKNGMSEGEVEQLLGSPDKVNNYGPFIVWYYGEVAGGKVQFDGESRTVTGWREPKLAVSPPGSSRRPRTASPHGRFPFDHDCSGRGPFGRSGGRQSRKPSCRARTAPVRSESSEKTAMSIAARPPTSLQFLCGLPGLRAP